MFTHDRERGRLGPVNSCRRHYLSWQLARAAATYLAALVAVGWPLGLFTQDEHPTVWSWLAFAAWLTVVTFVTGLYLLGRRHSDRR